MTVLSEQVQGYIERSSWIRKMFEAGAKLKAEFGEDQVSDLSLGNPDVPPPPEVGDALRELANNAAKPLAFGYMPNPGYPWAREALAEFVSKEQGVQASASDLIITCGAAGGLNALFRAVLNPDDEVLGLAPFFVEYGFYVQNHGGVFTTVKCKEPDFSIDLDAIEAAINTKTRAVLINSPNNPTGQVYTKEELQGLAAILTKKSEEFGQPILLISDEPYRFLTYDGVEAPSVPALYPHAVVVSSFSKNLSLAGERIGYVLAAPDMPGKEALMGGLALTNRILGYVNAPAIGQTLAVKCLNARVDVSIYERRRKLMAGILDAAGYEYAMPKGAFYFFPKAPGGDDVAFAAKLQEQRVLAVPGSGFGYPGYFRLCFAVEDVVIERSAEGFKKANS